MKKDNGEGLTDLTGQGNHTGKSGHTGKGNQSSPPELEKSKEHIIVEIIEYVPNAVDSRTIIKKTTGNVTVSSFATGEELAEKTSPFDTYIQIIHRTAR